MSPEPNPPETDDIQEQYNSDGIQTLLNIFTTGEPDEVLHLKNVLTGLQKSAFGIFIFISSLPAFIPVPGFAGLVSGPLIVFIGLQMALGVRQPWLPNFIGNRGPRRSSMIRFIRRITPWLQRLDKLLKPRLPVLLKSTSAHIFTGILLVVIGVLLALPIPFTNYIFCLLLLMFAFALLENDGGLMLGAWIFGIVVIVLFGVLSDQTISVIQHWIS